MRDELDLGGAVTFEGFTEEPARVLASAGASLMTSRREGFGLAVAESLAVGTPVVSYDVDYGPAELVADGANGRLVRNGSVGALATALVEALTDLQAWQRMSAAGPASVEHLRPESVAAQWLALADAVAGRVHVPAGALLVEDLRMRRDGLEVSAVALGPGRAPVILGIEGRPETGTDLVPGEGSSGARDVTATLQWPLVGGWPVGAALRAEVRSGQEVPVVGPGLPVSVALTGADLVMVAPDEGGVPRRTPADRAVLDVQPGGARVPDR